MKPSRNEYNYNDAGFDNFMSRSIDNVQQATLDSAGPQGNVLALDRMHISGSMNDAYRIGDITLDGKGQAIQVEDKGVVFFYVGPRPK